jgi:transmembrane sensor
MTRAHEQTPKEPTPKAPTSKTADEIEQQATEWLIRVDRDGAPEMSRALAAWLSASPRHRAAFLRISTAWRRADALRRLADPGEEPDLDLLAPERPPANESITEPPRTETAPPAKPTQLERPQRPKPWRLAVAAALAVAFSIAITAWMTHTAAATQTYTTAIGEFHRIPLSDGSSISLNTNTKVRVAYAASQRRIELLQGEAQFDVARDPRRPFVVNAGDTVVRAVGTAFVVRLRNETNVDVLVSEGRVTVNPPVQTLVAAGQMALIRGRTIVTRDLDDISRRTAWTQGMLIFSGETLAEAVAEFNRYNRRQLVIDDPTIARRTIGGQFKATNPDGFASALEKIVGVDARVHEDTSGGEIRLTRAVP